MGEGLSAVHGHAQDGQYRIFAGWELIASLWVLFFMERVVFLHYLLDRAAAVAAATLAAGVDAWRGYPTTLPVLPPRAGAA